jgi:hypothetical protein
LPQSGKKGGKKRGFAAQKQINLRREVGRGYTFWRSWQGCNCILAVFGRALIERGCSLAGQSGG